MKYGDVFISNNIQWRENFLKIKSGFQKLTFCATIPIPTASTVTYWFRSTYWVHKWLTSSIIIAWVRRADV